MRVEIKKETTARKKRQGGEQHCKGCDVVEAENTERRRNTGGEQTERVAATHARVYYTRPEESLRGERR